MKVEREEASEAFTEIVGSLTEQQVNELEELIDIVSDYINNRR